MSQKPTVKQKGFALSYMETGNASEAYRQSYNVENMSKEAIWVEGCRTLANPKVALMVYELQEAAKERTMVTIESITAEYDENRIAAAQLDQPAAMNTATTGKAKLHGLLTEKAEVEVTGNLIFRTIYEAKPNDAD